MPTVAAFDVDGTLTRRDSVVPFLWRIGRFRLVGGLLRHPLVLGRAAMERDRDVLKALAVRAVFASRDVDAVEFAGRRYASQLLDQRLRPDTVARLRWHQSEGHRVVLVSASLDVYLVPLGQLLGVDGVLCSQLERDGRGAFTGRLVGANCRGGEKVVRLEAWLADHDLQTATIWAYGDSAGDDALLERADHAQRVHAG